MTRLSPAELLAKLEATVPRELVSERALAGLQATLGLFPRAPLEVFGLECRLGSDARVDLGIGLNHTSFGAFPFDELAERSPAWGRIAALARRSITPGTPVHRKLSRPWLELDDAGSRPPASGAVPLPAIVIGIDEFAAEARTPDGRALLLDEVLVPLAEELAPAARRVIERCFTALPPGPARVTDVGVFLSRGSPIRVCIGNVRDDELPSLLAQIGWPGRTDVLARTLEDTADARQASPHPEFLVHLDVGAELLPRIGLEFLLERRVQLAGAIAEAALLDQLVARDLCSPDKRAALDRWPGHVLEPLGHGQRLGIRRLNSIKLVWDATGVVHAKAYLVMLDVTTAEPPRHEPLDRPSPA